MNNENKYASIGQLESDSQKLVIESDARKEAKRIELGWVGAIFGEGRNCVYNIAGLIAFLSFFAGVVIMGIMVYKGKENPLSVWDKFSALITMSLGYLFGAYSHRQES